MGLVRYCINLDEILPYLPTEGTKPSEYIYETGWQRSKGFRINNISNLEEQSFNWKIDRDEVVVTGLRVATTSLNEDFTLVNNRKMDKIDFIVNGETIFESVYLKDIALYKEFKIGLKLKRDDIIEIKYYNSLSTPVELWFDIDFLSPPELYEVVIKYQDENGLDLFPEEVRKFCVGEHTIVSKEIDNYLITGDYFQIINIENPLLTNEVIFIYNEF